MDPQFVERRRYPRAKIEWPVTVKTSRGTTSGYTLNLSAGGATVRLQDPPLVHETIEMIIRIPKIDRQLAVKAEVVWSTEDIVDKELTLPIIGLNFTEISDQDRWLISTAVAKVLRSDNLVPTRVVSARRALEKVLKKCIEMDL
ncbi:MAG: PilZ domain-containing protein [Deltaproteobacteria bacterium]|nr:PilZ domain-containing protein [Deltaproteobacteria bacterium]